MGGAYFLFILFWRIGMSDDYAKAIYVKDCDAIAERVAMEYGVEVGVANPGEKQSRSAILNASDADSIAIEAIEGVYGAKQAAYGDSIDNHRRIALIANAIKDIGDANIYTADNVAMIMMALKLSRIQFNPRRDSFVDLLGYTEIRHRIKQSENNLK